MIEEVLYPAMEARKLHLVVGKGPSARTLSLDLPPFTLIAATTRENLLSQPLRSRFGATLRLNFYDAADITKIIKRSAKILNVEVSPEAIEILSRASRGTPRIANRLLRRARDFAEVHGKKIIDEAAVRSTLEMLEIDEMGLEPADRRLLLTIIEKFNGGPVGVNSLAVAVGEEPDTIEEVYEPYLIMEGYLNRTSQGRVATELSYKKLGLQAAAGNQSKLF